MMSPHRYIPTAVFWWVIILLILLYLLVGTQESHGQESTTLTTAVVQQASGAAMRVARLDLNRYSGRIEVTVMPWVSGAFVNKPLNMVYDSTTTPTGASLIVALNKANLSTPGNSLEARVLKRLILDGYLTGTVTGAPE